MTKRQLTPGVQKAIFEIVGYLEMEASSLREDDELDQNDDNLIEWADEMERLANDLKALKIEVEIEEAEE